MNEEDSQSLKDISITTWIIIILLFIVICESYMLFSKDMIVNFDIDKSVEYIESQMDNVNHLTSLPDSVRNRMNENVTVKTAIALYKGMGGVGKTVLIGELNNICDPQ